MEVLVVDDSAFMRNMMKNILSDMDRFDEIREAENGQEAVEKFKENPADLVTLDVVMDEMGGVEALEEIKEESDDVKVIMVSAVGQEQMVDEAMEKGAETFVDKPFEEEDVKETLDDIFG